MKAMLVDCADRKAIYGFLTVEDVDVETVQNMLWDIKAEVHQMEDWTIEDIFARFPSNWKWSFEGGDYELQI